MKVDFLNLHKEGYIPIIICLVLSLVFFSFSDTLGWIALIMSGFCCFFFRDPPRVTPVNKEFIISPADGIIKSIGTAYLPAELKNGTKEKVYKISIFLNVGDVHVNRIPIDGVVIESHYHPGKFFNASLDKASVDNERRSTLIRSEEGKEVAVVQIAGLIARRIVCNINDGQSVIAGKRFGIIKFGSRVDVYLPEGVMPTVFEGQRMVGGETVLAKMDESSNEITLNVS